MSLEEILFRMKEIKKKNKFDVVELQFQEFINVSDERIEINDIKLRKRLPPILKKYRFSWTFHDDYRLGSGKVEEFLARCEFYKKLVKNPTITFHLINRGNEKEFEQIAIEDGKKIRKEINGAKLYIENNSYLPNKQPFSDVNKIAGIVRETGFDGVHLDVAHYLDSKDCGGTTDLSQDTTDLIKYVHVSGPERDLKRIFPKRWGDIKQILRKHGKSPRHLPLVKNSLALDIISRLDAEFYILEIDPERISLIGANIWKMYPSSISLLSTVLKT
jgi:hypothetical protein